MIGLKELRQIHPMETESVIVRNRQLRMLLFNGNKIADEMIESSLLFCKELS